MRRSAPHIAEELWARLGHGTSLAYGPFPVAEQRWLVAETIEYPIQVNGKLRARAVVPVDADAHDRGSRSARGGQVWRLLGRPTPRNVIVIPGRMVNVVV